MSDIESTTPSKPASGYFADYHNVRLSVAEIRQIDELKPEQAGRWQTMSVHERLAVLQRAEDRLARLQDRPAKKVIGKSMAENKYGEYDGTNICVNTHPARLNDRAECVNTLVHEGRHAYQDHALQNKGDDRAQGFHPDERKVSDWELNDRNYVKAGAGYATQPLEQDAGGFGFAVTKGLYPDYQPSSDRIDQYNARVGHENFGMLKLSPESLQPSNSQPAFSSLRVSGDSLQSRPEAQPPRVNRRGENVEAATKQKQARLSSENAASQAPSRAPTPVASQAEKERDRPMKPKAPGRTPKMRR